MTGKTHMLGGIAFGAAGALVATTAFPEAVSNVQAGVFIMGSAVGALIPDIDHPSSVISRKVPLVSMLYKMVAAVDKLICKLLGINYVMGHRGITHSIVPITALLGLLLFFGKELQLYMLLLGLIVGCYSHVAFDMLNPSGVPILLPFSKKRFRFLPKKLAIPTKSLADKKAAWKESAFAALVLVLDAVLIYILLKGVVPA